MASRAIFAKVPNRAFLRVTGTNSAQLLNGLITTTVPWPPVGGFYSAFLAANVSHNNSLSTGSSDFSNYRGKCFMMFSFGLFAKTSARVT